MSSFDKEGRLTDVFLGSSFALHLTESAVEVKSNDIGVGGVDKRVKRGNETGLPS